MLGVQSYEKEQWLPATATFLVIVVEAAVVAAAAAVHVSLINLAKSATTATAKVYACLLRGETQRQRNKLKKERERLSSNAKATGYTNV